MVSRRGLHRRQGILFVVLALGGCGSSSNAPPPDAGDDAAVDGSAGDVAEAGVVPFCGGFVMPNPAGAGLPNPASYTMNGDGTITDNVTGLVWEAAVDDTKYELTPAADHCTQKGAGWRLPTRIELVSLVDFTVAAPGPTLDPVFGDAPDSTYWTSSGYYGVVDDEWYVGFDAGYSDYGIINQPSVVRCVRAPASTCVPRRYEPIAGGLVVDHATGLTWQRTLDPGEYSWDDAIAYCKSLGAGWRVPSMKETQTIVDDHQEFPAVDPTAFPDTPSVDFWTGTAKAGGGGAAWYVDFFYGASDGDVDTRLFRVRCVR